MRKNIVSRACTKLQGIVFSIPRLGCRYVSGFRRCRGYVSRFNPDNRNGAIVCEDMPSHEYCFDAADIHAQSVHRVRYTMSNTRTQYTNNMQYMCLFSVCTDPCKMWSSVKLKVSATTSQHSTSPHLVVHPSRFKMRIFGFNLMSAQNDCQIWKMPSHKDTLAL